MHVTEAVKKIRANHKSDTLPEAKKIHGSQGIDVSTQAARVRHVIRAGFSGRRIVVLSGGAKKGGDAVYQGARDILDGGDKAAAA